MRAFSGRMVFGGISILTALFATSVWASAPVPAELLDARASKEIRERVLALPEVLKAEKAFAKVRLELNSFARGERRVTLRFDGPKFKASSKECSVEYVFISEYREKEGLVRALPPVDSAWIAEIIARVASNPHLMALGSSPSIASCHLLMAEGPGESLSRLVHLGTVPAETGRVGDRIELALDEQGGLQVIGFHFRSSGDVWGERMQSASLPSEPLRKVLLTEKSRKRARTICPAAEPGKVWFLIYREQAGGKGYEGTVEGGCEFKVRASEKGLSEPEWSKIKDPGPI